MRWKEAITFDLFKQVECSTSWSSDQEVEVDPAEEALVMRLLGVVSSNDSALEEPINLNDERPSLAVRIDSTKFKGMAAMKAAIAALEDEDRRLWLKARAEVKAARKLARQAARQAEAFARQEKRAKAHAKKIAAALAVHAREAAKRRVAAVVKAAQASARALARAQKDVKFFNEAKRAWIDRMIEARDLGWSDMVNDSPFRIPGFEWRESLADIAE